MGQWACPQIIRIITPPAAFLVNITHSDQGQDHISHFTANNLWTVMDQMSCYAIDALGFFLSHLALWLYFWICPPVQLNVKPMREAATSHIRECTDKNMALIRSDMAWKGGEVGCKAALHLQG